MTTARPDSQKPFALSSPQVTEGMTHLRDPLTLALQEHLTSPLNPDALLNHFVLEPEAIEKQEEEHCDYRLLQPATRLSRSLLWQIQEDYYARLGTEAWNKNVPFFITSSTFIAETYADMIRSYLLDHLDTLDRDEPVYIVELATGIGRFSFYLIKELQHKLEQTPRLRDLKWRYIMTDFTEKNIEFWEKHEKFQPFIEAGRLDFAVYRPEKFQSLNLRHSGTVLTGKHVKNPLIAIANYFFDTIRQDFFRVTDHRLEEGKIFLAKRMDSDYKGGPLRFQDVEPGWIYEACDGHAYDDPELNRILKEYRDELQDGSVVFPIGAFDCIRNLKVLSNDNLVLISSDKGFTDMEYLHGHKEPHVALHGAFSFMVNYNAVDRYFRNTGGRTFCTYDKTLSIQTVMCIQQGQEREMEQLEYMFHERLERQNPINFICNATQLISLQSENQVPTAHEFNSLLGFIRLNLCDPNTFCHVAPYLIPYLEHMTIDQEIDLQRVIISTWRNYYHFPGEVNLPFWLAQIFLGIRQFMECVMMVEKTVECFGPHEALDYLKGKAFEGAQDRSAAIECYEEALRKNPEFAEARECLEALRK